jgi:hypothetical protein
LPWLAFRLLLLQASQLKELCLGYTSVSDGGLRHLSNLTQVGRHIASQADRRCHHAVLPFWWL